jgi:hypothetical protein
MSSKFGQQSVELIERIRKGDIKKCEDVTAIIPAIPTRIKEQFINQAAIALAKEKPEIAQCLKSIPLSD